MKRYFSLIKACMSEGMNIFKINTKRKNNYTKIFLPIILTLILMGSIYSYADILTQQLQVVNMEFVTLTLFIILTSILTLIEGIYKSGSLLFNCKDDDLLFSLPLKKSTVLFTRILKFYIFELLYNSLFIIPSLIVYAVYTKPALSYYIISIIGLLLFPIIPILISCIIGTIITFFSSRFKGKNTIQTLLTIILLLGIMYMSYNSQDLILNIANNASNINDFITKLYYPAGAYIDLVNNFSFIKFFEFIIIHIVLLLITTLLIGRVYFKINSSSKTIKLHKTNRNYKIKTYSPIKALIKKEFNRFINSTVFIINAGFGLILFIIACVLLVLKFDTFVNEIIEIEPTLTLDNIKIYLPLILFTLVCFSSFMTSITSSMISLEGKSFNILKSLPVKPYTIIKSKVLAAVLIMIPFILIGDIIVFIKFKFDIINIILILISSILLPFLTETIGIMVNLKYPRMDAKNDTEIVKQSMSSAISVFIGMGMLAITAYILFKLINTNLSANIIMLILISAYTIIYIVIKMILQKTGNKAFNEIIV